jgi:hypothetical protein
VEVDNAESRRLLEMRTLDSLKPKKTTKFLGKDSSEVGEGLILPGTMGAMKTFNSFIVSSSHPFLLSPILTYRRKPKVQERVAKLKSTKQHAYPRTSSWTRYSPASAATITGP